MQVCLQSSLTQTQSALKLPEHEQQCRATMVNSYEVVMMQTAVQS
jgi:hypothetical protein